MSRGMSLETTSRHGNGSAIQHTQASFHNGAFPRDSIVTRLLVHASCHNKSLVMRGNCSCKLE